MRDTFARNAFIIMLIGFAMLAFVFVANPAHAQDVVLKAKVTDVSVATDKNGTEYVRAIVTETRSLGGITYEAGVPVMFFRDTVETGKSLQIGDQLECIANESTYNGSKSYTFRALLKQE